MGSGRIRLFLVRHGETDHNAAMRYIGRTDLGLNPRGRAQARALGEALEHLGVARVMTSPLRRARDTAREIARRVGVRPEMDGRLAEMDFGTWEGLTRDEVRARSPDDADRLAEWEADPWSAPPGGRGLADIEFGLRELLSEVSEDAPAGPVALVSHVGPMKALLAMALGDDHGAFRRIFLDPATVSVVDWGPRPTIRLVNSHAHLGWESARWMTAATTRREV
jgi:broad specificity phosphatase PhoE